MSNPITADEFAEKSKTSGASFPVSGTIYPKEGGKFFGDGTIQRTENHFVLRLTFAVGSEAPGAAVGTYRRDDFWRFVGFIGANLPVAVDHLIPAGPRHRSNGITSQEYSTDTLSLLPLGFDMTSIAKHGKLVERTETEIAANDGKTPDDSDIPETGIVEPSLESPKPSSEANDTWIHAIVPDFPLIHTNGGTNFIEKNDFLGESSRSTLDTFFGSFKGVQYGLVERGEDLNVYLLLSAATNEAIPVETHEQFLTAFLTGLAFATGQDCLPYRVIIRRNGAHILDEVHAVHKPDRTPFAPFSERIGFNAAIGNIDWPFSDFLGKATVFFNRKTALSEAVSKALWLLRASGAKGIPGEISLSSLCVLLESLTGLMFAELKLEVKGEANSFEEAKAEVKAWLEKHQKISEPSFSRLRNLVGSASLFRPVDKYRAVCDHFVLQWEGLMKEPWDMWNLVRNKSVHAALDAAANDPGHNHFNRVGRIVRAINVLALKLIGYSGIARTSVFEDKHDKI